jgi:hypothetical protein
MYSKEERARSVEGKGVGCKRRSPRLERLERAEGMIRMSQIRWDVKRFGREKNYSI